jgi:site-specific recombinase XerD
LGIRQAFDLFLIDRKSRRFSPNTIRYYQVELRLFLRFLDAAQVYYFGELTADVLRRYMLHQETRRNPGGCLVSFRAVKTFLRWAWEEFELEGRNPITRLNPPKTAANPLPGIGLEDIQKMVDACRGPNENRDRAILFTLLDTGVRAFELTALDLGDIDLMRGAAVIRSGKGGKRRTVFLGQRTRKAIRRYLKERTGLTTSSPLFITDEGDRLTYWGLRQVLRRLADRAGVKEPGAHDFRRAFALTMLRNGADLLTVSRLLGHGSVLVTQRYLNLNNDDLAESHRTAGVVDRLR